MTATKDRIAEAPGDRVLVIDRVFDALRHVVFEAWTKKEHLDRWCAPRGFTIPHSGGDLRPGGAWESLMVDPDGVKHPVGGLPRNYRGREHETVVTVRFADEGNKTKVTLEQGVFKSIESRTAMRAAGRNAWIASQNSSQQGETHEGGESRAKVTRSCLACEAT